MIKHITFDWQGVLNQVNSNELFDWIVKNKDKYNYSILSNYSGDIDRILKKEGFGNLFETIITPRTSNYHKPDPKIFETLLSEITNNKKEILFVDDSSTNVQAAKKIGFEAIHFKNNESFFKAIKNYE